MSHLSVVRSGLVVVFSLLVSLTGLGPAPAAQAASGYTITSGGARVTTTDKAVKLTVTFKRKGKVVKKATASLQYRKGSAWKTEKKVKIRSGKGSVKVKHGVGVRTYRFKVSGKATSKSFVVRFVPASFTISGSGYGHGVGLAQYGAYQLSRSGKSVGSILSYYYPGASLSTAENNPRTVKVQIFGAPADSKTTTTATMPAGFNLRGDTATLASYSTGGKVVLKVSGTKVSAKLTLANGKVKNRTLTTSKRLTITAASGAITVAGAQGSYAYGNLQAMVIGGKLNIVNELKMNSEYLYGIDEMPSSWGTNGGQAALQAQVVVARNYVINQVIRLKSEPNEVRASCDCHVYDDTRSQNFVGWKKAGGTANKSWVSAVNAMNAAPNSKVYLLRDPASGIAETPYFSSTGSAAGSGTGANSDVFGTTAISYLKSVSDPYSAKAPGNSWRSWSRKVSQARLAKAVRASEPVKSVKVVARYPGGLVKSLRYVSASGKTLTQTRTAEGWRTALGLPGDWIGSFSGR